MSTKVLIDKEKRLAPSDVVELHFKSSGMQYLAAVQIAAIEYMLSGKEAFTILNWSIPENNVVIFTVRVNKTNPVIITCAIIAGLIIAVGVIAWLNLQKVYQIVDDPAGKLLLSGTGALAIALAIAIIVPKLTKGK